MWRFQLQWYHEDRPRHCDSCSAAGAGNDSAGDDDGRLKVWRMGNLARDQNVAGVRGHGCGHG